MFDHNEYPYRVNYLYNLTDVKKLPGSEIRDMTLKMMQQLWVTKSKHKWSHGPGDTAYITIHGAPISYSKCIDFATEEDMLAFRLTWGIHT